VRISPTLTQVVLNARNTSDRAEQTALQQMTTGRRVNQASDDPAAAAVEVNIAYQMDSCDQYLRSISSLQSEMQTADSSLNSAVTALQSAISLGVEGANGTLSQQDRETLAQQVEGISQQVLGVANLSYNGHYVFAGTADAQPPYVADPSAPGGIAYKGNDNVNTVEIETGQSVAANQPGSALFSAAGANVFQALSDLATALQDPNGTTDEIGNATTELRTAYDQLDSARAFYGNTVDQLNGVQNFLNSENVQLSQQQNSAVGVDANVAATNLTNAEQARNATVQAAASLNGMSLMDYLSTATGA
jgi:flagellar hook-associated protein 3 FlgL